MRLLILALLVVFSSYAQLGWTDLGAGTQLISVAPPNNYQPGGGGMPSFAFHDNFHGITDAWSGGIARTKAGSEQLIIMGGGHVAYTGNDVYALNLSGTPSVSQLRPPSIYDPTCAAANADNTPLSQHTYGTLVYIPTLDKMFGPWAGVNYCATATDVRSTYMLDLATTPPTWAKLSPTGFDVTAGSNSTTGAECDWDTNTSKVWCYWGNNNMIVTYDPSGNSWAKITNFASTVVGTATMMKIDPVRKLMVFVGDTYSAGTTGAPHVQTVSIDTGSTYAVTDLTGSLAGCTAPAQVDWPGMAYDEISGHMMIWPNGGNSVYELDLTALTCTAHTFSGGPSGTVAGTFGRFARFPTLNKYAVCNVVTSDCLTFSLVAGSGSVTGGSSVRGGNQVSQ